MKFSQKKVVKLVEFILEKQNFQKQIPVFLSQKQQKFVLKKYLITSHSITLDS
jgi:hypothetical protein